MPCCGLAYSDMQHNEILQINAIFKKEKNCLGTFVHTPLSRRHTERTFLLDRATAQNVWNSWSEPLCTVITTNRVFFKTRLPFRIVITRSSADADTPARRFCRSVNVTKHSTIPYASYSFLLCNSNFVFKTRRFYDIRLQKCMTLKAGSEFTQGHWKCFHSVDRVWFPISVL